MTAGGRLGVFLDSAKKLKKGVRISQLSILWLRKNKLELAKLVKDHQLDLIGLNETRLSKDICDNDVSIEGYDLYRPDRDTSGGGVAIYKRSTLSHHKRDDIKDPNLEIIGLEITPTHAKSYIVLCWYCPPADCADTFTFLSLTKLIRDLDSEGKEIILIGDTNCDLKKSKDCNTRKLKLVYSEFQFKQLITDCTRVATSTGSNGKTNTTRTLIDHLSTNRPNYISSSGVIEISMSDHYMIYGVRQLSNRCQVERKQIQTEFRCLRNYDREAFVSDLQNWKMATPSTLDDPNILANNVHDLFHSILDVHAPLKTRKHTTVHAPSPWIAPYIKSLIYERDRAKRKAERDQSIRPEYKRLRNRVTSELRRGVETYYQNLLDENSNNPKKMRKTINKGLNKNQHSTTPKFVMFEGQSIEKPNEIAEVFINHFTSIGPKLADKIENRDSDDPLKYLSNIGGSIASCFEFHTIHPNTIEREIKHLKCSKSTGHDKVSVKLVKDATEILSEPLAIIFNSPFNKGIFLDIWKIARATSICKSGSKSNVSNYRPISVLSVISRLLEKIGHYQFSKYLKEHKKFAKCQHAFLKMHSSLTSLLSVTDTWFSNIDKRKLNISIFLDLKKAFDTVDHGILLSKLSKYGAVGTPLRWFASYLTDRTQYCEINAHKSCLKNVLCGIPQGSCLGPLLFILYVNEL